MPEPIYTVGHSNHTPEQFLQLLSQHRITAICDVRSQPYSKYNPLFRRDAAKQWLAEAGVSYVFMGYELGARSSDKSCYKAGKVVYDRLARQPHFQQALNRLVSGSATHRIALLCAEKEPLECHRCILISRHLSTRAEIRHILADGRAETHHDTVDRLLVQLDLAEPDMFRTAEETRELAYSLQEDKIAYVEPETADSEQVA